MKNFLRVVVISLLLGSAWTLVVLSLGLQPARLWIVMGAIVVGAIWGLSE